MLMASPVWTYHILLSNLMVLRGGKDHSTYTESSQVSMWKVKCEGFTDKMNSELLGPIS